MQRLVVVRIGDCLRLFLLLFRSLISDRAAQRAFRERKQNHLADLQARLQMYEQEEVERNVSLQNIAKRLKEENEVLHTENLNLQARVSELETELNTLRGADRKRGRNVNSNSPRKKSRVALDSSDAIHNPSTMASPLLTSSSSFSSSDSAESPHIPFDPLSIQEISRDDTFAQHLDTLDASQGTKSNVALTSDSSVDNFNCGFCNDTVPCLCREVVMHERAAEGTTILSPSIAKEETTKYILDDLPKYQPPVPLRRRSANPNRGSVFPVFNRSFDLPSACTGDPLNCPACAADDFGKAFCAAVNQSAAVPCDDCPGTSSAPHNSGNGCCGNPAHCEQASGPSPTSCFVAPSADPAASSSGMISCDSAWRQLKLHPNVESSDLSVLAEVVARRSKCLGPRVLSSPVPKPITTPERTSTPVNLPSSQSVHGDKGDERLAWHTENHHNLEPSFPSKLVPQEVLARCGREQRVRTVHVDAVQAALRLLDAKSTFYKL
jgi:AP-1-like transcription factor